MSETLAFSPPQRRGLLLLGLLALLFGTGSAAVLFFGLRQQPASGTYLLMLGLSVVLFLPLPLILYLAYALLRASYRLERDGLRLRWGLRAEDIPLPEVEWVRRAEDLAFDLPRPRFSWPGAVLGTVNARDLGTIEYMASTAQSLVLVATTRRIYAISPEEQATFLRAFRSAMEMGSITPISSATVLPAAYITSVWRNRLARILLSAGLIASILVFVMAGLAISTNAQLPLGFDPQGQPLEAGPAQYILLLPVLTTFAFVIDLTTGLYLYQREARRVLAYIVWASSTLTATLFLLAILLLVRS